MKKAVRWGTGLMAVVMVLLAAVSCGQAPAGALPELEGTPSQEQEAEIESAKELLPEPEPSQEIDLDTGAGLAEMLAAEDAQVYIFGEAHRRVEYQKFRNVLFKYLVEEKGVRVLLMEHGYASGFIENETIQNRMPFPDAFDQFTVSQEDYELFQWMSDFNQNRPDEDKISIVGVDITDSIGMVYTFCKYLLKDCDFSAADVKTQMLLISIQKCQWQQRFEDSLLPQLSELMRNEPEQLELVLGDKMIHLERVLLSWQQEQECNELNDYQDDLQLDSPAMAYREDALYENIQRVYQDNPTAKYFGSFGAGHVQMTRYVGDGTIYWIDNCFVSRMAGEDSFLNGKLTVIDGVVTHEIGDLGKSDTNHIILYNTALAKNPVSESGKFFAEAPDTPDEKIAQYAMLLEHPDQITNSEEHPGWYWNRHEE